jgi:predicted Zn finger-like uncharacterized protein
MEEGGGFSHKKVAPKAFSHVKILYISDIQRPGIPFSTFHLQSMSDLLTQCPHCNTSFRVSEAQQNAAGGLVRCGSCLAVFSAIDNEIRIKQPVSEQLLDDSHEYDEAPDETAEEPGVPSEQQAPAIISTAQDEQDTPGAPVQDGFIAADELQQHTSAHTENFAHDTSDDAVGQGLAAQHDITNHVELSAQEPPSEVAVMLGDDEKRISLGDMRLDDDAANGTGSDEVEPAVYIEPAAEQDVVIVEQKEAATVPTAAEEKVHVRQYLSSLDDDDEQTLAPLDDAHLDELDEEPLTFTARKQRSVAGSLLLFCLNLLLLAGLGAQWLYWNRATLTDHPRFSFLAPQVCEIFSCPEPAPLPVANALSSKQLLVRTHPRFPDALELSFIFDNVSTTSQPFPNLELAFSDINNQLLANRLFTPSEYLPVELQQFDEMPPQTSVQVVIDLADPGEDAVNYNITLHQP